MKCATRAHHAPGKGNEAHVSRGAGAMCGLCGEINFKKQQPTLTHPQDMLSVLESRGPDASGLFVQDNVALGHRRLSILDLSAASQQPMIDDELGLALVFN